MSNIKKNFYDQRNYLQIQKQLIVNSLQVDQNKEKLNML